MFKFINKYFLHVVSLFIFIGLGYNGPLLAQSDSTRLLTTLQQLCTEMGNGRKPGTEGHQWVKELIIEEFKTIGLEPLGKSFLQTDTSSMGTPLNNIHGLIRGSLDRYILIGAHYDHLGESNEGVYYGCDDNASGVAAMLEMAHYFANYPTRHSLIFIAFDLEETGLLGAMHWVENPVVPLEEIAMILNMDMISKNDKNEIFASGTAHNPSLRKPIEVATESFSNISVKFGHDKPNTRDEDWTFSSDHGPFHSKGVPHLYFGVEDHPYYHQTTDSFERTNFSFYWQVTNFLIASVEQLDKSLTNE